MSEHAIDNARAWLEEIKEMVTALKASGFHDEARQRIEESVLSVTVRGGWHTPGDAEAAAPEEYQILLSTGGPALRILGELEQVEPDDGPNLQWQDWGVPWTAYPLDSDEMEAVAAFARCFYFGE